MRHYSENEVYELFIKEEYSSSAFKWAKKYFDNYENNDDEWLLIVQLAVFFELWGSTPDPTEEKLLPAARQFSGSDSEFVSLALRYFNYVESRMPPTYPR
jgi:hypothetical protein